MSEEDNLKLLESALQGIPEDRRKVVDAIVEAYYCNGDRGDSFCTYLLQPGRIQRLADYAEAVHRAYETYVRLIGKKPNIYTLLALKAELMPTEEDITQNARLFFKAVEDFEDNTRKRLLNDFALLNLLLQPHRTFPKALEKELKYKKRGDWTEKFK